MRDHFDSETFVIDGEEFEAKYFEDRYARVPWEECDGHGPVRYVRDAKQKRPGERVLWSEGGRNSGCYLYDWQEAIAIAKRDGWDAEPCGTGTRGERAARAVEADYKFLRAFCRNDWAYVVVEVTHVRSGESEIIVGFESYKDGHREGAREIAAGMAARHKMTREDFETCMAWD